MITKTEEPTDRERESRDRETEQEGRERRGWRR